MRSPAIVTDAGSTKRAIGRRRARRCRARLHFVGGHPLAGAASGGIEHRAPIFRAPAVGADAAGDDSRVAVDRAARRSCAALGAVPLELDAETHDRVLAFTSHLPQLTASALMQVVGEAVGETACASGGGLADTTRWRPAPPDLDATSAATNADEILPALDRLIESLQ